TVEVSSSSLGGPTIYQVENKGSCEFIRFTTRNHFGLLWPNLVGHVRGGPLIFTAGQQPSRTKHTLLNTANGSVLALFVGKPVKQRRIHLRVTCRPHRLEWIALVRNFGNGLTSKAVKPKSGIVQIQRLCHRCKEVTPNVPVITTTALLCFHREDELLRIVRS